MSRAAWTGAAISGGVLLALSLVSLLPMIREGMAVHSARARFDVERLDVIRGGERNAAYECGGTSIVLRDGPARASGGDPGTPDGVAVRRPVAIEVSDTAFMTIPVAVHEETSGANRYWNRVVPFRWTDHETGSRECGVVYRLGPDTVAARRARKARPRTRLGFVLESVRGTRPPYLHALRFRVLGWQPGGPVSEQDFAYPDWDGDPHAVLVANLLGSPIGIQNQSLSYWPSLLFPVVYPLGSALLGVLLIVGGLVVRHRVRQH